MIVDPCIKAIGPFAFDHDGMKVTVQPGVYRFTEPVTFGLFAGMEIAGIEQLPFADSDGPVLADGRNR